MESRRAGRTISDPKVRQVGFFTPGAAPPPDRSQSVPIEVAISSAPPVSSISPSGNTLSPVMIPPARHASDTQILVSTAAPTTTTIPSSSSLFSVVAKFPPSPLRRPSVEAGQIAGSYNPSEVGSEFFDDFSMAASGRGDGRIRRSGSGFGSGKLASSLPSGGGGSGGGFELMAGKNNNVLAVPVVGASSLTTVSVVNLPPGISAAFTLPLDEMQHRKQIIFVVPYH